MSNVHIGEIKKGALALAHDLQEIIPINQKINRDYNQLLAELDPFLSGTSSEEVKSVSTGIKETLTKLEQEKANMMAAIIDIQYIANKL